MGADALLLIKMLATFSVVLLALLDAAAEVLRQRLLTRRELRRRFGKRLRSRPAVEEDTQELTLEDTQELTPVQRPRRRLWR
jgi:ribose 1,5-bisphosphokinase PhnN